jgi:hypothetical protein
VAKRAGRSKRAVLVAQSRQLITAIRDGDDATVEAAVLQLSQSRRILAPLAFAVGAFVMLFQGVKLLFSEWHLTLVQVLPAMWIWAAMLDLKVHVLKGHEFRFWRGPGAVLAIAVIAMVTVAAFYLNVVFAFAIARPGRPQIKPAFDSARQHRKLVAVSGSVVGVALGFSVIVVPRWGLGWFAIALGIVVAVMMLTYVTVPSRLAGMKAGNVSRRDRLTTAAVGGAVGALVCTPPYVLGRIGIILLGSRTFFVLGVILLIVGLTLQAGATGAVKAIKVSAKLMAGQQPADSASSGESE